MPRGGKRQGTPGTKYANRSDLRGANTVSAQPVNTALTKLASTAVPGQQYGQAAQQLNAQKAVPMAGAPAPLSIPAQQAGATQGAPQGLPGMQPVTPLNAPTDHGLPITTGLPNSPGAGPEVMSQTIQTGPAEQALAQLRSLGDNVSPQVAFVRNYLAMQAQNQSPHGTAIS